MSKVYEHLNDHDVAMITSFITSSNDDRIINKEYLSHNQNRKNNKDLAKAIRDLKYSFIRIVGYYSEGDNEEGSEPVREESFFVINPEYRNYTVFTKDMVNLAKKFEQESVIVWNYNINTATCYETKDFKNYRATEGFKGFSIDKAREYAWTQFKKNWFEFGSDGIETYRIYNVSEYWKDPNDRMKLVRLMFLREYYFGERYR